MITESACPHRFSEELVRVLGNEENVSRDQKKALIRALLEVRPLQFVIDFGKQYPAYRSLLNQCLPSWVKFRGVYSSFEEARRNAPKNVPFGYDHEKIALGYKNQRFLLTDYPMAFWLREVLRDSNCIFDLGGSVGISFYQLREFFEYPERLEWTVCDVPSVAEAGRQLAIEENETRLRFTANFENAEGVDCLLASGSLQYIEAHISESLRTLQRPPRHLIINRVPLHRERACITLQNIRWVVAPYRVFLRDKFVDDLKALGYDVVDAWAVPDHSCWIPLYPECSVSAYSGLYLRHPGN